MVIQEELQLSTDGPGHIQDITDAVRQVISETEIQCGIVSIFNVGSTAAIGAIEYEPGLCRDLPELLNRLIPASAEYGHEQTWHDGNGHSHLQATTLGPEITVPIRDAQPVLGTWQQIFHLECDVRPRSRTLIITVLGE